MTPRLPLIGHFARLAPLFVLVALLVLAGTAAPTAAAAEPACWKRLVNDWYDGRIDEAYPVKCYRDAIDNLPEDVIQYSNAREEIQRALLAAIKANNGEVPKIVPPPPAPKRTAGDPADGDGGSGGPGDDGDAAPGAGPNDPDAEGGALDTVFDAIKPSNADSVPLPLLILAGLSMLLLGTAAATFAARRIQARRMRVAPSPAADRRPR